MSLISHRQGEIFKFIKENEPNPVKLNQIVKKFEHWYYSNGRKHVSDIVFRMFSSGKLNKPKTGHYLINYKYKGSKINNDVVDKDQLNLF